MDRNTAQILQKTPAAAQWNKIGMDAHHGIAIPLFALHSQQSCGIGEYPDLIPMIHWCRSLGFDILQLLPLNDTGIENSPYSAISANALNPLHLGLRQLPFATDDPSLVFQLDELNKLNHTQRIDYARVHEGKERFLRDYYRRYAAQFIHSSEYRAFKEHYHWLTNYTLFKALKIKFGWQTWESWPEPWKHPQESMLHTIPTELKNEIEFQYLVQYLCFLQLEAVKKHADQQGIFLKGDIPILINRESADVWFYQHLFILDFAAGAPPDMFSEEGQKWGFPIYDWTAVKKQNYQWWTERLHAAQRFYHIYRIDHIVGFFRIWAIPLGARAKEGYFYPIDERIWLPQGEENMRMMLANSSMLPIGEDLGVVPTEVRRLLQSLGICGTKVMRWERRWNTDQGFIPPETYLPESMTTVSTHDSETLALWWKNNPQEAALFASGQGWKYSPELTLQQRLEILRQSHHSGSIFHVNLLQEYFPLIPNITWDNPEDERINIPGTVSDWNWGYRFRPSVEKIISNDALKNVMMQIVNRPLTNY
jgi:4-alpha-glucanotransferase